MINETMANRKPAGFRERFIQGAKKISILRRAARWWVKSGHDVRILSGAGAGLLFNVARSNPAYALGTNEIEIQNILAAHLAPGGVFYDIGANVGFFSVLAARMVGAEGSVISFEPLPSNLAALRHNVAINGFTNVTIIEAAVSSTSGRGELLVSAYSGGSALATATPPADMVSRLEVALVSIDELIASRQIPAPDMVKIDVEGAELEVLGGMVNTLLHASPVILYEIDDNQLERFQSKEQKVAAFLQEHGYIVEKIEGAYTGIDWLVSHGIARKRVGS